jgi:LacI family transcriptional regulator, galactose operon repressor
MSQPPPDPHGAPSVVTIAHVARRANVSRSTVSRVLSKTVAVSPAKRAAVLAAVEELDYRPNVVAQGLARGRSQAIGVLPQGISNPFYGRVLQGVEQGLRGTHYYPIFASGGQPVDEMHALDLLLSHRAEALVLMGGQLPDKDLVRLAGRVPLLAIGRSIRGLENRCMRVGNREGAHKATRHLINIGHTRIAHIVGLPWHNDAIARREGYERALRQAGLQVDPALVVEGDFEEHSGLVAVERLLASGARFTAIFAANDQMAYGAGLALFRHGLHVPDDVSLVGFDDQTSAAFTWPPLTTVRQPALEMGVAAARALVDQLSGRGFALPSFSTDLVLRDSTAPPRQR